MRMKKTHRLSILFPALLLSLILTACGGRIPSTSWPGLSVDQSKAYLADGGQVFAVNLNGLTQAWVYPEKADATKTFYSDPVVTQDGQVLLGCYNNVLYSVDASTGKDLWNFPDAKGRIVGNPLVTKNGIYLPSADSNLYALTTQGKVRWTFKAGNGFWSQPVSDGTNLYISSMDHFVYALSEADGKQVWKKDLGAAIPGTPALSDDGKLYVGTLGNQMFALDSASGRILWQKPTDGGVWGGPAVKDQTLYFGGLDGGMYFFNRTDGSLLKKVPLTGSITGTPLVDQDQVVIGTGAGNLAAFDFKGTQKWIQAIGGKLYTSPKLVGDRYLIAFTQSSDKLLDFVNRTDGTVAGAPFNLPK